MARFDDLELEYKIATTFSLGMLISGYNYELSNESYYMKIVMGLNDMNIPPE